MSKKILFLLVYFSIWFGALVFLNYSILRNEGVLYTPIRLALIGVLLYGKFMLLGQAIKLVLGDQEMKRIFLG
jgi:ABC-type transport system involved in cytochrome c biogenesis permease subunit